MGSLDEFSLGVQLFLRAYPWRRIEPVPWAARRKPLAQCRLGLVSSAGFALPSQAPFGRSILGGDVSFRLVPGDVDSKTLVNHHRSDSFDHSGMLRDVNVAFPIDRAREMVQSGRIGSVANHHVSFMGSITATGRLIKRSAPEVAEHFKRDQVDIALLVPV